MHTFWMSDSTLSIFFVELSTCIYFSIKKLRMKLNEMCLHTFYFQNYVCPFYYQSVIIFPLSAEQQNERIATGFTCQTVKSFCE